MAPSNPDHPMMTWGMKTGSSQGFELALELFLSLCRWGLVQFQVPGQGAALASATPELGTSPTQLVAAGGVISSQCSLVACS